jgi:hypothetical protein
MAKSRLLDSIPDARRVTILHEQDGKQFIESRQDTTHIVEAAKILADQPPGKDFRHVGFIPEAVMNQAFTEGWFGDKAKWKAWFNDPDNVAYRTWKGRL